MSLDYSKKQALIVRATKSLVDELLAINTNNRNIKKAHKKWLEDSIERKEFILTSSGIGVSAEGILVDGQHRLSAIREAGYPPVELLIVTGLDGKSMMYVDQHAKRTTADMLKVFLDKTITTRMAAIINSHLRLVDEKNEFRWERGKPPLMAVSDMMEKYVEELTTLTDAGGSAPRAGTYLALFHYLLKSGEDAATHLATQINTGEKLLRGDPAYKMREYLQGKRRNTGYGSTGQMADYKVAVAVCIAHSKGESIDILRPAQSWEGVKKKPEYRVIPGSRATAAA